MAYAENSEEAGGEKHYFYRWENPTNGRYYMAYVHLDLMADWVVTCGWGGKYRAGGRILHMACASYLDAIALLHAIEKKRIRRGYLKSAPN